MEVGYGTVGEPCRHGGSDASHDRDLARSPAGHRSAHTPGSFCGVRVPRQPLGLVVGHVMDLGTTGSGARIAPTPGRARSSAMGHRRLAGTAAPRVPVVVMTSS